LKGFIGGFGITKDAITGSNIIISGSPAIGGDHDPTYMFISSSNWNLKENGDMTGSRVHLDGGAIGGFELSATQLNSVNDNLILKDSGQITASNAQIQGKITDESGTIGGFNIGSDLDSTSGTLKLKGASGQITASAALVSGSNVTLGTDTFRLNTTNLLMESSTPQIRVGASNGQRLELKDASLIFKNPSQTDVLEFTGSLTTIINVPTVGLSTGGNTTFTANGAIDISSAGAVRQAAGSGNFHEGYWDQRLVLPHLLNLYL
jgi:hypothetical protein